MLWCLVIPLWDVERPDLCGVFRLEVADGRGERVASGVVQYFLDPMFPSSRMQVIPLASCHYQPRMTRGEPLCVNGTEPLAISLSWLSRFLGCSDKHKISQATVNHRISFKGT